MDKWYVDNNCSPEKILDYFVQCTPSIFIFYVNLTSWSYSKVEVSVKALLVALIEVLF